MKPSELIRLALKDLEACEKDPDYEINMNVWHKPVGDQCMVCLAGAVMAQTFEMPKNRNSGIYQHEHATIFYGLDELRQGKVRLGVENMTGSGMN